MNIQIRNKRKYIHNCTNTGINNVSLNVEICPDCGQAGRRSGWSVSMFEAKSRFQKLTGLPANGIHRRFLPVLSNTCFHCQGEGFVDGPEGMDDEYCPSCSGLGKILVRSSMDMEKIQAWALRRHERSKKEGLREMDFKLFPSESHSNTVVDSIAGAIYSEIQDKKKNGLRNQQIGRLMLKADAVSWDFFLELIEKWEKLGGGLAVHSGYVLLTTASPDRVILAALHPGSIGADSWICLRWDGLDHLMVSAEKINNYHIDLNLTAPGKVTGMYKLVNITETMGLVDAREYLLALKKFCTLQVNQKKG